MNYKEKIDYSSLSTYIDCPRKFFFQYMLHLRLNGSNLDLVFGSCWHYGLEVAYLALQADPNLGSYELCKLACDGFAALWRVEGSEFNEEIAFPKNPGNAFNMYDLYFNKEQIHIRPDRTILGVETPFTINLGEDLPNYTGRLDLTELYRDDAIEITDHKTAKYVNDTTLAGYNCSLQSDGYLIAGTLYYDKHPSVIYSIAQVAKTKAAFFTHTVMKGTAQLERSLDDIKLRTSQLLNDITLLEYEKETKDVSNRNYLQQSFPRSPGYACTMYFRRCAYYDLCHMRNNAISWELKIPSGYHQHEWDPEKHESEMKEKLKNAHQS